MTLEFVGFFRREEKEASPVFAVWLAEAELSLAVQLPDNIQCPRCSSALDLSDLKREPELNGVSEQSFPVQCGSCDTVLYFDKRPEANRLTAPWRTNVVPTRE